jgi:hypothetical protein
LEYQTGELNTMVWEIPIAMPRKQIGFRKAIPKADEMQAAS